MKNVTPKSMLAVLLIFTLLNLIIACDKNPTEAEKTPPVLPSVNTMQVNLSLFTTSSLAKENSISQWNFTTAVITVTIVNAWVVLGLAAPVFVFGSALQDQPELQSDGKFHWIYNTSFLSVPYTADLAGWLDVPNTQSVWEMYITFGSLNNFLWYDGRCNFTATSGDWIFYDETRPDTLNPKIRIDWINNSETDRSLTFTNVFAGNEYEGDILKYTVNGTALSVEFYDASVGTTVIIAWDAVTTAGYIQAPYYNNGQPAYWDENHNDLP